ncbi:TATA-binding protein-associated factor mot1 [Rhizoclosmatium hyalinum]|nr:TATA-binding protein-associated factor mot1 [Rhizoclosmatium hyalinum]
MDGSTDSSKRHDMVQKFNADPSIDVFLLTTAVGGLGLNLTGADTVIFVEHDWNPMKDLQAMDRAHRIGQKRVVNVYRLITRGTLEEKIMGGTLEEKIMGLQKFKLNIASSIINQDNAGIESMETSQILDLFSLGGDSKSNESADPNRQLTQKEAVAAMGALWDEKQYESFDDMGDFLKGLGQNE